ncbi:MAG: HAD-IA family hydrolase [Verrucomicrobiota bacterium]
MKLDTSWAIFFDAGHTLLHPNVSIGAVYAEIACRYGVAADAEQLDTGFRVAWSQMKIRSGKEKIPNEKEWWKVVVQRSWIDLECFQDLPFDDYFEAVYSEFARPELWSLYPDVRNLLDWLCHRNICCGILSNWDERLRHILAGHAIDDCFDPIIISGEQQVHKPDLEIFAIAEQQTSANIYNYVLVGDDPDCDRLGAENAGWSFYHVNRPQQDLTDFLMLLKAAYKD